VPHRMPLLLDQIDALLEDGVSSAEPESVLRIERTLTDGYASALALEGERLRIERQIEGVAEAINNGDSHRRAEELSLLARRRTKVDGDLAHLRDRLGLLRSRARELRSMLPQPQAEAAG
jgi:hypothetical protein